MKLFYTLAGISLAQEKYCQPGRAIGIDKDGNVDEKNTENCYVTKEAAQVTRCNEVGGNSKVTFLRFEFSRSSFYLLFSKLNFSNLEN